MPQVFESDIVYDHPPTHALNWLHRKYPNPYTTHVHSIDTISRTIDPETGIIRSERVLGVQQAAPKWIARLFSLPPTAYVREVVFINPAHGPGPASATMMSVNLSMAQYLSCLELITYTPHPANASNPTQTLFHQKATLFSAFQNSLIARKVEKEGLKRFDSNAGLGKRGFEWVLENGNETDA